MNQTTSTPEYRIQEAGCYVKIRYTVRIENGPVIKGGGDLELMDFVTGYAQVIPGLEKRLMGHCAGDKLSFTVPPDEAFGIRHEELVFEKNREDFHFPAGMEPYPGMELPLISSYNEAPDTVIIKEIKGNSIVIDCNHPLSGKTLQYNLEVVEARPATQNDVCSEWEEQSVEGSCASGSCASGSCSGSCSPYEVVLGQSPEEGTPESN